MTKNPVVCMTTDDCKHAAQLLWDYDVGALPVVDDDEGTLVGIVTDRDICLAILAIGASLAEIPISQVMASQVRTCRASDTLDELLLQVREERVRRLPVVDDRDIPVGIISINDLIRYEAKQSTTNSPLLAALAATCEPRSSAVKRMRWSRSPRED